MTIHKVCGTETEYGISVRNQTDFNPAVASGLVVNSYEGLRARVQWSFEEESPGRDARGFGVEGAVVSDFDTALVNVVLSNGARLYVDHAHPEYSTPECFDPLEAALHDKAGEVVMARAGASATSLLETGQRMGLYKNNSDGKGNSYGAHENYLLSRDLPFADVIQFFTTFLVTRQIFTGAGKVGSENGRPDVPFQLTQRADFFEEQVGLETTLKRPIINTRDEPHGDPSKYRRLHVIMGDANLSEVQTFLKLGTAALFLAALEDGYLSDSVSLDDPVEATWRVSHDLGMGRSLLLENGGTATALELQWQYFEWLNKYVESAGMDPVFDRVLDTWEGVLTDLGEDAARLADRLDWAAKLRILEAYRERDGLEWDHPRLAALDLQYHDIDPERGLYYRLAGRGEMQRLFTDAQIEEAVGEPPERTRAYFRGRCVSQFSRSLVAANWDSLVFEVGEDTLKRVPMMEPLRGTKELVDPVLEQAANAAELVRALGGSDGRTGPEEGLTEGN